MRAQESSTAAVTELLGEGIGGRVPELRRYFDSASPFRHVVIDGFLEDGFCRRLLAEFPPFEESCAIDENQEIGRKAVHDQIREIGPAYRQLDVLIQSQAFLDDVSRITGIPGLLYDPEYIGGGTHENLSGQALDIHVDFNYHHIRHWHRRLNLLLFLNHDWRQDWGGVLELRKDPYLPEGENQKAHILPLFNRAVLFETSEHSWHGFSTIHLPTATKDRRWSPFRRENGRLVPTSRKSVALYFYTENRPEAETAPPRSTIYIDEPLPGRIKAGVQLSEIDEGLIRSLIDRRDKHLRRLYDHEQMYCTKIQELEKQLRECRAYLKQRLPLEGAASQIGEAVGVWDDLWTGNVFEFRVIADLAVQAIRIDGALPVQVDGETFLRAEVLGREQEESFGPGAFSWTQPIEIPAGSETAIRITTSRIWIPRQHGESEDERPLAFLLKRIYFEPRSNPAGRATPTEASR